MDEARVSKHAVKRMRQRLGLSKKATLREAARALEGIAVEECGGMLRRWLEYMRKQHGVEQYRLTPAGVYVFTDDGCMITVLPVPPEYAKDVMAIWKSRKRRA